MTLRHILLIGLAVRLAFAAFLPLGVDENYAIAVAREFSWSFFDHPPLGFWSGVIVPSLTGWEHPLSYRLPFLIMGTVTIYLMYLIGRELRDERTGLWTALLYSIAPFFALSGSVFVVPDGPLNLAGAFILYHLIRITKQNDAPLSAWIWVGLGLAVAMMSKYQAGLIPIAMVIYALIWQRRWFLQPGPYVASFIGLVGLAPVVIWNIQNDWISFAFQSGRSGGGFTPVNFLRMLLGQMIYLLPPILIAAIIGLWKRPGLVMSLALAPLLMFNVIYLISSGTLPHWTMPGWQFALPLAAFWITSTEHRPRRFVRWLTGFAVPVWGVLAAILLHANTGILSGRTHMPPAWDNTLEFFDYSSLPNAFETANLAPSLILTANWITAGQISTALGGTIPVRPLSDPHHFQFMTSANLQGEAFFIAPSLLSDSGKTSERLLALGQTLDPDAELLRPGILDRGGIPYVAISIVRLTLP